VVRGEMTLLLQEGRIEINAPTGRMASVSVRVNATFCRNSPNAFAMSAMRNVSTKKSNASKVHPRKLAITAFRSWRRSALTSIAALSVVTMGWRCDLAM